jgi:putative phosphoesterase
MVLRLIGLISDTHIPGRAKAIPEKVFEIFQNASLILHAGDLTRLSILEELEQVAPVIAVHGNMDNGAVKRKLPKMSSVDIFDWKIGLTHSLHFYIGKNLMREVIERHGFNVFVSGHTHRPSL